MSRERVVVMERIKDEARWIGINCSRSWQIARTIVLWDDGSTDTTSSEVRKALLANAETSDVSDTHYGWRGQAKCPEGLRVVHFIRSPYAQAIRPKMRAHELRDKTDLWWFVAANIDFDYVLCLDGDEWPSLEFIHHFPKALFLFDHKDHDVLTAPFCYLWDGMDQQRDDAIYGPDSDGIKRLRFPRLFTIKRVSEQSLFDMRFAWQGTKGALHCGSLPREAFKRSDGTDPHGGVYPFLIVHAGYENEELRQSKYAFYRRLDPSNPVEGDYAHIIGKPDHLAPGPVVLKPWSDEILQKEWII